MKQGQNNVLLSEQQNAVRELKATLKSRPMRRLKDLQKQKYDTSQLFLGVQGGKMELGNKKGTAIKLLEMELSNDYTRSDTNDDDDTILKKGAVVF